MRLVSGFGALLFSIFLSSDLYAEQGDNVGEPLGSKITEKAGEVGAGGDFTYSVDFNIPKFRGLEPELGLSYRSSRIARNDIDAFTGFGWRLGGLSIIQRQSLGGGVPTYRDGADVYEIDGRELLACATAWTRDYPLRYRADKPSPSCSNGGNLTARVEDYTRYFFDAAENTFIVTRRDGVQFEYTSLGAIAGDTSAAGTPERRFADNTYWFLTSISDTQRGAGSPTVPVNKVTISYFDYKDANSVGEFAIRPKEISYAGYKVRFGYTALAKPLAQFPTSTTKIGEQQYLLKSVSVFNGSAPVRAYDIDYTTSGLLGTRLLSSVQELGSDFVIEATSGAVTAGSRLPATTFEYSSDAFSLSQTTYPDVEFHEVGLVHDRNADGQDELALFPWAKHRRQWTPDGPEYPVTQSYLGKRFAWGDSKEITRNVANSMTCATTGVPNSDGQFGQPVPTYGRQPVTYVENDRTGNRTSCLGMAMVYLRNDRDGGDWYSIPQIRNFEAAAGNVLDSIPADNQLLPRKFVVANIDLDPEIELASSVTSGASVHDVSPTSTGLATYTTGSRQFFSTYGQDALLGDFTGDGVTDSAWQDDFLTVLPEPTKIGSSIVSRGYAIKTSLPSNQSPSVPPGIYSGMPAGWTLSEMQDKSFQNIGDLNGDGINDVTYLISNNSNPDQLMVYYGTGRGFVPVSKITLPANLLSLPRNIPENITPRTVSHRSEVVDINSDGLSDLIIHDGFTSETTSGYPGTVGRFVSKNSWVFLNKGNENFRWVPLSGQVADENTFPGFSGLVFTGDFNGDGLTDIVREGASGRILYGTGVAPNRLKKVNTSLGGSVSVSYTPSSAFGQTRIPFVQQLVTKITSDDGRGQTASTAYSYSGGAYDFLSREPLGYRTVTSHLPKIGNEEVGPSVKRTYFVDSIATSGILEKEERFAPDGTLLKRTVNDLATQLSGNGPYMARVVETIEGYRNGIWIETKSSRTFNQNGLVTTETNFGFTAAGEDIDPKDNRKSSLAYTTNSTGFILDRIITRRLDVGPPDDLEWLSESYYYYDDEDAPRGSAAEGNLVLVKEVNRIGTATSRIQRVFSYDDHGNIVSETDARGNETTHTYDSSRKLFRTSTTNAVGDVTTWVWNTGCQTKSRETDPNLQQTNFSFDAFCREVSATLPGGQVIVTSYLNFGDPNLQRIKKVAKSGSANPDMDERSTWEYTDGLGRIHMTASTGGTNVSSTAGPVTYVLSGFDDRGNLAWQSIPRYSSEITADPEAVGFRTEFSYDSLDREVLRVEPDGAKTSRTYLALTYSSAPATVTTNHPGVEIRDAHCLDATDAGTACGPFTQYLDAFGNKVLEVRKAFTVSDVPPPTNGESKTHFRFDGLDRLVGVTDPIGAVWSYVYNGWGDRTRTTDPGLGTWNLTYDAAHNLATQIDAKGQTIAFTYDDLNRVKTKRVGAGSSLVETHFSYGDARTGAYNNGHETTQEVYRGTKATGTRLHKVERDYFPNGKIKKEAHEIDDRTYVLQYTYAADGSLLAQRLPLTPNSTATTLLPALEYDAASRVIGMDGYISTITYDPRWGAPKRETLANGVMSDYVYDAKRGWLTSVEARKGTVTNIFAANYTRTATGRIKTYNTLLDSGATDNAGSYSYTYDAAGRLLTATAIHTGQSANNQVMTYDAAGRIRSKGTSTTTDLTYTYATGKHAPSQVGSAALVYDANGNMTTATDGRTIAYDAENRPISVVKAGVKTCYIYGADGARLKKISDLAANQNCATIPATVPQTVYFGPMEIENFKLAGAEKVIAFPHPNVKLVNGAASANASYLHRDHLGSVRAITGPTGARVEATVYKPYGERTPTINLTLAPEDREDKGWIGERFDPETGLQYLNARYYDPMMGMFIQPDWWEVTKPDVGTNRYAYSFGDPVNKMDPGGNSIGTKAVREGLVNAAKSVAKGVMERAGKVIAKTNESSRFGRVASRIGAKLDKASQAYDAFDASVQAFEGNWVGAIMSAAGFLDVGYLGNAAKLSVAATKAEAAIDALEAARTGALRNAMGGSAALGSKQAHHGIPVDALDHDVVQSGLLGGFGFNSPENGIAVLGQSGSHPKYSDRVRRELDAWANATPDYSNAQAADALRSIVANERRNIDANGYFVRNE